MFFVIYRIALIDTLTALVRACSDVIKAAYSGGLLRRRSLDAIDMMAAAAG